MTDMTAIKAEPSRESILEEIEINQRIGADHRFSEEEWAVIIAALRAPAGEPVAPNNGESLITVKIPEGYASTWDFLNDCGLEAVYPSTPAGDGGQRVSPVTEQWELHRQSKEFISDYEFSVWCDGKPVVLANAVPGEEGCLATIVAALNGVAQAPSDRQVALDSDGKPVYFAQPKREPIAAALARRLCQLFDSGGESQRSVRARHASAIFQILDGDAPEYLAEQRWCDASPISYLERCEALALSSVSSTQRWSEA